MTVLNGSEITAVKTQSLILSCLVMYIISLRTITTLDKGLYYDWLLVCYNEELYCVTGEGKGQYPPSPFNHDQLPPLYSSQTEVGLIGILTSI